MWHKIGQWIKRPHGWPLVAHYVFAALAIAGACVAAALGWDTRLQFVAYILFAVAAISLAYTVYTLLYFIPKIKRRVTDWAYKYEFTEKLIKQYGFRTIILSVGSLALSLMYAVFNGVIAVLNFSIWYGALAAYYTLLASMRGGIIFHHRRNRKREDETDAQRSLRSVKTYRACGGVLIFLPLCLSGAVTQMVLSRKAYNYAGLMIYAAAAYTFYKIIMSIVNLVKARKADDHTVRAIRNINFADALVSVLALQTAMFRAFSPDGNYGYLNAVTGGIVCLLTVLMGVLMVIAANKNIVRTLAASPAYYNDAPSATPDGTANGENEND